MSDDTVAEADCVLCRDLDPTQRSAMRADLIVIPLREPVCDHCMEHELRRTGGRASRREKRRSREGTAERSVDVQHGPLRVS
jgi:hypothetical protein